MPLVQRRSWFGRIGGSIIGALIGGVLLVAGFPVLFVNEGRAIKTHKALQEGVQSVITIENEYIDPDREGQLVHLTGTATVDQDLTDPLFQVTSNAIRLERIVEMYQWQEDRETKTRKRIGGGEETVTTYSYDKTWAGEAIDHTEFHESHGHENPVHFPVSSTTWQAESVRVGAFRLPDSLVDKIGTTEMLQVSLSDVPDEMARNLRSENGLTESASGFYWPADSDRRAETRPQVGDVRIRFRRTPPTTVSVVSAQAGRSLRPYPTSNGRELNMLSVGQLSSAEMFARAEANNVALTWGLRFLGALLMFAGVALVMRPLSVLADIVPAFGSLIGFGIVLVAALIAAPAALFTISIGWLMYRPMWGIPLCASAVGLFYVLFSWLRKNERSRATFSGQDAAVAGYRVSDEVDPAGFHV